MFTIERNYYLASTPKDVVAERAKKWQRETSKDFSNSHEWFLYDNYEARPCMFYFTSVPLMANGKYYSVDYNFLIVVYPQDNMYTVKLQRLEVSAYKGRRCVLSVQHIPIIEEEYNKGDYAFKRHHKEKVAVSQEMKKIAAADFESLLPSIREYMSGKR